MATRARPAAVAAALAGLALAVAGPVAGVARAEPVPRGAFAVPFETVRIDDFGRFLAAGTRFGALEWLGGLEIRSASPHFGGLSGVASADRGRDLLLVSDLGFWVAARLDSAPDGKPLGLASLRMAAMLGERGAPLGTKRFSDAESLVVRRGPAGLEAAVGFEGRARILRFAFSGFPDGVFAAEAQPLAGAPAEIGGLVPGKGLESLAAAPDGTALSGALVAIAEGPRRGETDSRGFIIGGGRPGRFTLVLRDGFAPTDAAFLPEGDLLILERRFAVGSLGARIRRIPAERIAPEARLDGEVLFEADLGHQIDNMEGLAVDRAEDGGTILTLISDDNRSILQRTLVLRFRLAGDRASRRSRGTGG